MLLGPKIALISTALFSLTSFSGIADNQISSETLRQLDPSRIAGSICGQRMRDVRSRLNWIRIANLAAGAVQAADGPVMLIDGLGDPGFAISTQNPLAQRFFNQGLMLTYGFNHAEAIRAFREAQRLDPECAMCWWGEANALGPNINAPMDPATNARALEAIGRADALKAGARPEEQALILAQKERYSAQANADRPALDQAYATAILDVAKQFPQSDTIAVLAAEAEMDVRPWDYWEADRRTPKGRIGEAVRLIETVLARSPDHPEAAHLYIHLMESAVHPERAEKAADRLVSLVPGSGHLVHMPAHLYYVLGRFKDSIRVNVEAARVDESFLLTSKERGIYRFGYYPHNIHFIVTSAQMGGDSATALREAQRLRGVLNADATAATPWVQPVDAAPFLAYAQFAEPNAILALKAPDSRLPYVTAMWHYARSIAYARSGNDKAFDREISALRLIRTKTDFKAMTDMLVPVPDLLKIAELVAQGRREYAHRRFAAAADFYRQAATLEQGVTYYEPPFWYYPVQQSLGAALYRAGDLKGARQAFMHALGQFPNNGWALYGLAETNRALGDRPSEAAARAAFGRAWLGNPKWISMDRI